MFTFLAMSQYPADSRFPAIEYRTQKKICLNYLFELWARPDFWLWERDGRRKQSIFSFSLSTSEEVPFISFSLYQCENRRESGLERYGRGKILLKKYENIPINRKNETLLFIVKAR